MFTATRVAGRGGHPGTRREPDLHRHPLTEATLPSGPGPSRMDDIDPADFGGFTCTSAVQSTGGYGGRPENDGVVRSSRVRRYATAPSMVNDPRFTGNMHSVHDYYKYDADPTGVLRNVGCRRSPNEDGHWVSTSNWGYRAPTRTGR